MNVPPSAKLESTNNPLLTHNNFQVNNQTSDFTNKLPSQKLTGFKLGHLNIASLMNHIDKFRIFVREQKLDILSINEARLDNTIHNNGVEIKVYDLFREDRYRNGRGVAIYVRSIIAYTTRNDLLTDDLEAKCLEIKKPKSNIINIYMISSPQRKHRIFLNRTKLYDLITEYQLRPNIKDPTRITPTTKTLLDIILTEMDDTKVIGSGIIHLKISDHSLVYLCQKVSIPKSKPKIVETRQFKHFDSQHFQYDPLAMHLI